MIRRDWTDELTAELRVLWAEGLSTAAIGRRLNISKNAVVGKAHRLNLPARPSPIKSGGKYAGRLQAIAARKASQEAIQAVIRTEPTHIAPDQQKPSRGRVEPCSWVEGVKGRWRYCDEPSVPNRVYCHEHCGKAYVKPVAATQEPELAQ